MPDPILVFLDTETTGVHRERSAGIAIIRRTPVDQTRLLICVDVEDLDLASANPAGLRISGFHKRHPQARDRPLHIPRVYRAGEAAALVDGWTAGATVIGVVPEFDTECLASMLGRHAITPRWRSIRWTWCLWPSRLSERPVSNPNGISAIYPGSAE